MKSGENKDKILSEEKTSKPKEQMVTLSIEEFEKLKKEASQAKEYWDRLLRLQADFDNARKRLEREKQEFIKYANDKLLRELLDILDDLERTLQAAEGKYLASDALLKGIEMILAHFYELLKKYGVVPLQVKGKPFDPHCCEVLMQVETEEAEENTVLEELQKGYTIDGRILRTAKVKVAKKSSKSEQQKGG